MLTAIQRQLGSFNIVLASASPRRRKLLTELAGIVDNNLSVIPSKFEENLDQTAFASPAEFAVATAAEKAIEVATRMFSSFTKSHVLLSADTVIEFAGKIVGKPKDAVDASRTLARLSGNHHLVHTGVTIGVFDKTLTENYAGSASVKTVNLRGLDDSACLYTISFSVSTRVKFAQLDDSIIAGYVATGESLDKAGSYGIQGIGSTLVESVDGDFYNVVGLPLTRLCQELRNLIR